MSVRSRAGPSPAEWIHYRETITQLYSSLKLHEVMLHMRTRNGFVASVKMYKTRIKQWGLDKNLKRDEALVMLALLNHYKPTGILPVFVIRGKQIDHADLRRYARRTHITVREVCAIQPSKARLLAPGLQCIVPQTVPKSAQIPDHLYRSESLIHALSHYLNGVFEANLYRQNNVGQLIWNKRNQDWRKAYNLFHQGCENHRLNRFVEAGVLWRYAFLQSESLVNSIDPLDWLEWIKTQNRLVDTGVSALADELRRHILSLAAIKLNASCPHRSLVKSLCSLNQHEAGNFLPLLCAVVHRIYQTRLPAMSLIGVTFRLNTISIGGYTKDWRPTLVDVGAFLALAKSTYDVSFDTVAAVEAFLLLVQGIARNIEVSEATQAIQEGLVALAHAPHSRRKIQWELASCFMLGATYMKNGCYELAKRDYVKCLEINEWYMECYGSSRLDVAALAHIYRSLDHISNESDVADGDQQWRLKLEALQICMESELAEAVAYLKI